MTSTPKSFLIFVTGVPGTGKTSFSRLVAPILGCSYGNVSDIARRLGVAREDPSGRLTSIVDDAGLHEIAKYIVGAAEDRCLVVETVFATAFLELPGIEERTAAIVLMRAHPRIVLERLLARGWPWDKAAENALSEALGVLSEELQDYSHSVIELDSTRDNNILESFLGKLEDWRTGIEIDWLAYPDVADLVAELASRLDLDKYRLGVGY